MSNRSQLFLSMLIMLASTAVSSAQTQTSINPIMPPGSVERRIVYTGKLLGHFRVPSEQDGNFNECPKLGETKGGANPAAFEFLKQRESNSNAILVGTGDNFSPQFEARSFQPGSMKKVEGKYSYGNKELFYWDGAKWVDYKNLSEILKEKLRNGLGTIPNDNVGCFLAAAKYAAVVPGKHDFYFGADRVRLLARFMAGIKSSSEYEPVQMLGANLVMNTSEIKSPTLLPRDVKKPWWTKDWPTDFPVLNLQDGATIYPWYSYVKVKLVDLSLDDKQTAVLKDWLRSRGGLTSESEIREFLKSQDGPFSTLEAKLGTAISKFQNVILHRCPSKGEPNAVLDPTANATDPGCTRLEKKEIGLSGNSIAYFFTVPREPGETGKNGHFSTVTPGKNYGLCSVSGSDVSCLRFSVYRPFFYHPHDVPQHTNRYIDPDPYVLTKDGVAIFGVVDPGLGEHVGVLNFGWQHEQPELKTVVSVQDPAQALRQQLDYFERRCREEHCYSTGLKILLAQMSPQRARVLGARLPEFQVIVTGADAEQGTSLTSLESTWTPNRQGGSFVAVPLPGFDRAANGEVVLFSEVRATQSYWLWTMTSSHSDPVTVTTKSPQLPHFWERVTNALSSCLPARFTDLLKADKTLGESDKLKWLTLCALREKLGADVALVQKRDFFDVLPEGKADTPENTQEFLDRLIWKGDLVTLLFVRGSALKQALKDSKKFTNEDESPLSLADEKSRQLEMLGIDTDKATGEFLIKELPIEDTKTYTVATTDYIGVGDTGYPALADAVLNPRPYPGAFPNKLTTLSGAVCRKMFTTPEEANKYCLDDIDRSSYLDETVAPLVPTQKPPSFFKKAWDNFLFRLPPKDALAKPDDFPGALKEMAQRRPFWILSVRNLSFGFTNVANTLTDAELDKDFAGVPVTAVQAHKSNSLTVGLNTRLSHFTHKREFFLAGGIDFKRDSKGISNDEPLITQTVNRIFLDPGVTFSFPGKSRPNWGIVLSVHLETPFQSPVSTFTLSTQKVVDSVNNIKVNDRLDISQDRSIQILPRLGLRLQNKDSFFEGGVQYGYEMRALSGYRFNTPGVLVPVECTLSEAETLATCITNKSKEEVGTITRDSEATAILDNRPRAGLYWKIGFSMPFGEKVKYELEDEGNYFFVNFHQDTSVDTRLLDISKHRLRFFIWPSVSIGPTYQLLFYRNKGNTQHWLTQKQFTFETVITFDLFNRRERQVQFKNKP